MNPNYASAWYNRASCNVKKGDIESGLADLKSAIEIGREEYIALAKQNKHFESIRNDQRFKILINE